MLALALSLVLSAPSAQATPPSPGEPTPPAAAATHPQVLESPAQVRILCEALTPSERLLTKSDVVERARAEADHDARRDVALGARYQVRIAADRLRFAEYDAEEQRLALSEHAFLG